MSEPVTNVEIEDVLSSIRRLISEDDREESRGDSAQTQIAAPNSDASPTDKPEPSAAASDRLVLTPALRVLGKDEAAETSEEEAASAEDHADPEATDATSEGTDVDGTRDESGDHLEAAPAPDEDDDAERPSEAEADAASETDDAMVADLAQAIGLSVVESASAPIENIDDDSNVSELAEDSDVGNADTAEVVEPDVAVELTDQAHEQTDTDEHAVQEPSAADSGSDDASLDDTPISVDEMGQTSEDIQVEEAVAEVIDDAVEDPGLQTRIAELERLMSGNADQGFEPEADEVADASAPVAPIPFQRTSDPRSEDEMPALQTAEIDEDLLRDMVAEIVRDELQGALGERITRNVRKLVRREIHRALASQDID